MCMHMHDSVCLFLPMPEYACLCVYPSAHVCALIVPVCMPRLHARVCMHAGMYTCIPVCVYACVFACGGVLNVCSPVCLCLCVQGAHICARISMCVCRPVWIVAFCVDARAHVYGVACACVCMYV